MADRRAEADDSDDNRPRRPKVGGAANTKVIVLVVAVIGLAGLMALVGLAVVGFAVVTLLARPPIAIPVPVATAPPVRATPVATATVAAPDEPPKGPVAAPTLGADPAADLYAPVAEGGVVPADGHATSPLRPRKGDATYKLANLRYEKAGLSPYPRLVIDYERTRDGTLGGSLTLVLRVAGKRDESVRVGALNDRVGRISLDNRGGGPFGGGLPTLANCECYLTLTDQRYSGGFFPTFKVSDSLAAGDVKGGVSLARAWTADEAARLRKSPPKWPEANASAGVGQDTPFAGDAVSNLPAFRYVEPGRPLVGLEWNQWQYEDVACLSDTYPIYDRDMPLKGHMPGVKREVAKPGYAVGGLTVKAGKMTHAMQVVYFKLTPAGTLDVSDSYTSEWLGNTSVAEDVETKLAGDGRLVIGVTVRYRAVLAAIALVVQGPAKK